MRRWRGSPRSFELDAHGVSSSLTIPWALGVPLGFGAALAIATRRSHKRAGGRGNRAGGPGGWRLPAAIEHPLQALDLLYELVAHAREHRRAWLGMTLYWLGELAALWAALRLFGLSLSLSRLTLAYATGYVFTPRTLPLAGVGVVEVFLMLALHYVGVPLAIAVAAVFSYRTVLLIVSLPPALLGRHRLKRPLRARPGY